jgi:hypothetical protein
MSQPFYASFEEFEREELRPARSRIGFSIEDIEESVFDSELEFDLRDEE